MTKKETISHDKASFYMAFKYLNKERTLEMWDYIEKNKQFAKDVARYFDLDDFKTSLTQQEWEEYKELRKTIQKGVAK